ncbi:hypothetical protein AAZX31_09G141000 [Glycine max]
MQKGGLHFFYWQMLALHVLLVKKARKLAWLKADVAEGMDKHS